MPPLRQVDEEQGWWFADKNNSHGRNSCHSTRGRGPRKYFEEHSLFNDRPTVPREDSGSRDINPSRDVWKGGKWSSCGNFWKRRDKKARGDGSGKNPWTGKNRGQGEEARGNAPPSKKNTDAPSKGNTWGQQRWEEEIGEAIGKCFSDWGSRWKAAACRGGSEMKKCSGCPAAFVRRCVEMEKFRGTSSPLTQRARHVPTPPPNTEFNSVLKL